MIDVTDAAISAVLISGDWVNVSGVVIDYVEFHDGSNRVIAHGQYLAGTIHGGPNNGQKLVAPLSRIDAVRV